MQPIDFNAWLASLSDAELVYITDPHTGEVIA